MNLDHIFSKLPDKWESKTTTSKKFKEDLYNFCIEHDIKSVLEIGASVGHSTFFLAHFIDRVTSVEAVPGKVAESKKRCSEFSNITFLNESVYGTKWNYGYHDLVIIDCIHDYPHVVSDITNSLELGAKFLAFDDYGLFPEVKKGVDEFINNKKLDTIVNIGYEEQTHFSMARDPKVTKDKKLADSEGIICRVIK